MTQLTHKKITFIGGGNMAQALITGLLAKGILAKNICVYDPNLDKRQDFINKGLQAFDPATGDFSAVAETDLLVLAVKPQMMAQAVKDFAHLLDKQSNKQLVISIAAGLSVASLSTMLNDYPTIVRAMPNTPAMIQMGATGLFASSSVDDTQKQLAYELLKATGLALWVDEEEKLHAVTAISGSAPAYFFYILETMIDEGMALGLTEKQASALAMQTALGSAQMAIVSEDSPAELRKKVTSPNGTTQSAIETMQRKNVAEHLKHAMQACYQRSQEIGK